MSTSQKNRYCCDPFQLHKKKVCNGLREVSEKMHTYHETLNLRTGDLLCTACRKKVYQDLSNDVDVLNANDSALHTSAISVNSDLLDNAELL